MLSWASYDKNAFKSTKNIKGSFIVIFTLFHYSQGRRILSRLIFFHRDLMKLDETSQRGLILAQERSLRFDFHEFNCCIPNY